MDLKVGIEQVKIRLLELWNYRIFKFAVIIHLSYFIISLILIGFKADFQVFYKSGEIFITNISDLYNKANYSVDKNLWFRYFPLCAIFFIPYSLLIFEVAYIFFNIVNFFLNIFICLILYKIILLIQSEDHEKDEKRIITYLSLFLIGFPQISNYFIGQINLYIVFLILLSLFILLKYEEMKWQLLGSFLVGISIMIKPIAIFLIPFSIAIYYDLKKRKLYFDLKKSLIRIIGMLIPIFLNLIMFFIYPSLLAGFLETNFSGAENVIVNFSFSITRLITNFFNFYSIPYNQIILFIGVVIVIGSIGLLIYIFRSDKQYSIIYGYLLGICIMLLVYFDSWDHHLLIITPLLIVVLFNLPRDSEIANKTIIPGFIALNFLNLIFIGVWALTESFFPYNFVSTIFLLLILYGIGIYSLKNDIKIQEN